MNKKFYEQLLLHSPIYKWEDYAIKRKRQAEPRKNSIILKNKLKVTHSTHGSYQKFGIDFTFGMGCGVKPGTYVKVYFIKPLGSLIFEKMPDNYNAETISNYGAIIISLADRDGRNYCFTAKLSNPDYLNEMKSIPEGIYEVEEIVVHGTTFYVAEKSNE